MYSFRYLCKILTKFGNSQQIFLLVPRIKFHENTSSGSRVDTCEETGAQTDGGADMTNLIGAFRHLRERA